MDLKSAYKNLKAKFASGNKIPVGRSSILVDEWEPIKKAVELVLNHGCEDYQGLIQCPYEMAVWCAMDEPCRGCETWAKKYNPFF